MNDTEISLIRLNSNNKLIKPWDKCNFTLWNVTSSQLTRELVEFLSFAVREELNETFDDGTVWLKNALWKLNRCEFIIIYLFWCSLHTTCICHAANTLSVSMILIEFDIVLYIVLRSEDGAEFHAISIKNNVNICLEQVTSNNRSNNVESIYRWSPHKYTTISYQTIWHLMLTTLLSKILS